MTMPRKMVFVLTITNFSDQNSIGVTSDSDYFQYPVPPDCLEFELILTGENAPIYVMSVCVAILKNITSNFALTVRKLGSATDLCNSYLKYMRFGGKFLWRVK